MSAELHELGYRGSPNNVYRFLRPYRVGPTSTRPVTVPPPKPKIRVVTGWIMRDPDTLHTDETQYLARTLAMATGSTIWARCCRAD
ncbi:hypothetical protein [Nocardia sp. NPDC049149]|uniref:hypothetical protein n=1 Tax=Nocardia sp. NPDC049149 TaxID=3364315 RepID=UPI0037147A1D